MDKELLRIIIIVIGLIVVIDTLIRLYLHNQDFLRSKFPFLGGEQDGDDWQDEEAEHQAASATTEKEPGKPTELTGQGSKPVAKAGPKAEADPDSDIISGQDLLNFEPEDSALVRGRRPQDQDNLDDEPIEPQQRFVAPAIIQFSIVAKTNHVFSGPDLVKAFQIAGLEYGEFKVFEHFGADGKADFAAACLVEPGVFPEADKMEGFVCPGIVFFMQVGSLDDAPSVFEELLEAVNLVAVELDGNVLDHLRKPLTNHTIHLIRDSL
jgi:cell division protein ZipA